MGNQAYKHRHKEQGLCGNCNRKAIPGFTLCGLCSYKKSLGAKQYRLDNIAYFRLQDREKRKRRIGEGRCSKCGALLMEEEVKYCVNCSAHICREYGFRGFYPEFAFKEVINDTTKTS